MVYYRKYRSQTIDELDSESLRNTLNRVLLTQVKKGEYGLSQNVPHAFLFTGPKGLGKTSTARIVAKVLNCTEIKLDGDSIVLCREHCDQCKAIGNGSNLDVLEIDGASNRGIDEIRDLRDKVRLAPVKAHKKVYIIDEVHMLTTEAFNALLKTIEEPPDHVVFIFCTTESHKVPQTIMSRCFNIPFHTATNEELVRSFQRIVDGEKLKADTDGLLAIANFSDGSFRDGAKILEEISLHNQNKKITKELVEDTFKTTNISQHTFKLINFLAKHDTKSAIGLIDEVNKQGIDIKYFAQKLIETLHAIVLKEAGVVKTDSLPEISLTDVQALAKLLSKAYTELKYATIEVLPLELAVIEWGSKIDRTDSSSSLRSELARKTHSDIRIDRKSESPGLKEIEKKEPIFSSPAHGQPVSSKNVDKKGVKTSALSSSTRGQTASLVDNPTISTSNTDIFETLVSRTKQVNQSIAGVLRGCQIKTYDGKSLVIQTKYKFHKERLDDTKAMAILSQVSREISGNPVSVSVLLSE